jgi:environmental stress-induced protein Ves
MEVCRQQDYRRMAWKNGGGETAEIAVFPQGATLDSFDWRISMATVAVDGPFSLFPGVDRTLSVLEGEGLILTPESRGAIHLARTSPPVTFPSDLPVTARLARGPIVDLNVMTRRGRFRHHVSRMPVFETTLLTRHGTLMLVMAQGGEAELVADAGSLRAGRSDTVIFREADGTALTVQPLDPLTLYVIDLWPA